MISPINTPNLFIDGNYYLTDQQENIKNEILKNIAEGKELYGGLQVELVLERHYYFMI